MTLSSNSASGDEENERGGEPNYPDLAALKLKAEIEKLEAETREIRKRSGPWEARIQKVGAAIAVVIALITVRYEIAKSDYEKKRAEIEKRAAEDEAAKAKETATVAQKEVQQISLKKDALAGQSSALEAQIAKLETRRIELEAAAAQYVANPSSQSRKDLGTQLANATNVDKKASGAAGIVLLFPPADPQRFYKFREDLKRLHFNAHVRAPRSGASSPRLTEVRYFRNEDELAAEAIRQAFIRAFPAADPVVQKVRDTNINFGRYFEIRISRTDV